MTANITLNRMSVNVGETVNDTADIEGLLKGSELATGTPLVIEVNTSDLTITNKAVNTVTKTVEGRSVVVGEGIDYTITGFVTGVYRLKITFSTDADPAATRVCYTEYEVCG